MKCCECTKEMAWGNFIVKLNLELDDITSCRSILDIFRRPSMFCFMPFSSENSTHSIVTNHTSASGYCCENCGMTYINVTHQGSICPECSKSMTSGSFFFSGSGGKSKSGKLMFVDHLRNSSTVLKTVN